MLWLTGLALHPTPIFHGAGSSDSVKAKAGGMRDSDANSLEVRL